MRVFEWNGWCVAIYSPAEGGDERGRWASNHTGVELLRCDGANTVANRVDMTSPAVDSMVSSRVHISAFTDALCDVENHWQDQVRLLALLSVEALGLLWCGRW